MKLLRRKSPAKSRRHRVRDNELSEKSPVFLYRSLRPEAKSVDGRQKSRGSPATGLASAARFWLQRLGLLAFLVAVTLSTLHILSLTSKAKVLVADNSSHALLASSETYEASANQLLGASIWNSNKVTIDTAKLSQQLMNQFPELATVYTSVPLLARQPVIYLIPAQPVLVLTTVNGSFVIDMRGKAIARRSVQEMSGLPLLNDQSGLKAQLNSQALPASNVRFVQAILAQLAAKHFNPSSMTLPASTSELDVQLVGQAYFVKFNLQSNDPRGQAGTFLATISSLKHQNITPAKYVDVRVDGRAYYQ